MWTCPSWQAAAGIDRGDDWRGERYRAGASLASRDRPLNRVRSRQAGRIDAFCDFVGSGGTFRGCAQVFRAANPAVRCYVVEPAGAAVLAGKGAVRPNHRVQGGGYSMRDLKFLRDTLIDGYLQVTDEEAISCARRLAVEEGVFAGFSTGANLAAALELLGGALRGQTIVTLACDSGLKYLSTDLWPPLSTAPAANRRAS